jgi:hypothetical protein
MKLILSFLVSLFFTFTQVNAKYENLMTVEGDNVFRDHSINQYDDVTNPAQGYKIMLPKGYKLEYFANPENEDGKKCSVSYDKKAGTVLVQAFDLETDSAGCYSFLIFRNTKTWDQETVSYFIEQVGT